MRINRTMIGLLMVLIAAVTAFGCTQANGGDNKNNIGGETDEHGCLIAAGYQYDSNISACIRPWELDESQRTAAKIAVDSFGPEDPTVEEVLVLRCPGCFVVQLKAENTLYDVEIAGWNVQETKLHEQDDGLDGSENYKISYRDGKLQYELTVDKPTPCHSLAIDEFVMESYPVQIRLEVTIQEPEDDQMCAQVITPETITGEMDIGHEPGSVSVVIDGKEVYSAGFDSGKISEKDRITNFAECVDAGNEILYPDCIGCRPYCETPEGDIFMSEDTSTCVEQCGDGICNEVVCMGEGCPCPENSENCPEDCEG
jgi:hypothetical protein